MISNEHKQHEAMVGRRGASRLRLDLPGHVEFVGMQGDCIVRNISSTGARLATESAPKPGNFGRLLCDRFEFYFKIQWRSEGEMGIKFDEIVDWETLLELRATKDNFTQIDECERRNFVRQWVDGAI